ncbi:pyrroloquinoline quinone biosynthesis peptide chaperone PqqD [Komagataeibacter sp. AV436]|uniref:Pyrroloquinoline quinone biosynthesis peptide chaperone PqqD n=1 Tax=Komagataeibacter melomenusus TaxID=2766578 RepID=A0ABX2ABP4_9PROT|nr:pyrroloquinoline quinone biosynthesis peptide chaperone PqqD [Komagataeibacter melomenusus]MBV1829527.1 pyrroloquinoline quinone biosynthesis peptide chaperone PqqD [Komagataeibacter melomenusus]NPC65257.1 pyrroloquinoline quinone biosynthesis peptide chaperone PqqD [Komagataeibacter melomenusus]
MSADLTDETVIRFARGVRLQHDRVRERWIIQAPERAFIPDPIAAEVLRLVDGTRTLGQIIADLASRFAAPVDVIGRDVHVMVTDLMTRQVLVA